MKRGLEFSLESGENCEEEEFLPRKTRDLVDTNQYSWVLGVILNTRHVRVGYSKPLKCSPSDPFPPLITRAVMMICHTSAYLLDIKIEFNPKITKKLKVCKDKSTSLFGVF
jgi:hypothetical protein